MKSIQEIERMSLEDLERIASDERIEVPNGFTQKIEAQIIAEDLRAESVTPSRWIGIAAAVAVIIGVGIGIFGLQNEPKDTFDDPYLAYAELERAFATMSQELRKGFEMADRSEEIMDKAAAVFD
ncbi:MAG: hypothetical protein IJ495_05935 [Bacteroidales bacterium]|nr:hypothetical protein [Bacteroidales bacterium]